MSTLSVHLDDYLKLRRQLGFKLKCEANLLHNFLRFAEGKRARFITTKLALEWATAPANIRAERRSTRLGVVRRFAKYVSSMDPRTEVPSPKLLRGQFRRRPPYLYQIDDIRRLIGAARRFDPSDELKNDTLATVLGLLAVTGMRVGEALGLDSGDVDLKRGLLTIRHAKGNKSRLVPLHRSAQDALQQYACLRDRRFPQPLSPSFFVSGRGTRLSYTTMTGWFRAVACQTGLRKRDDRRGPRIHDLRHHFAVQTLLRWYRTNTDVEAHLPDLTTYLGHGHVNGTYWYISAVPELLMLATLRLEPREVVR